MKLVRFGEAGRERPGIWLEAGEGTDARIVDVRAMVFDIEDYDVRFWKTFGVERLRGILSEVHLKTVAAAGMRLGPPVATPRQIICLGKNYRDHAAEFDAVVPKAPVYFAKAPSALTGPTDAIQLPGGGGRVDGEVELALVVGRRMRNESAGSALSGVAGYTILNDVTHRDLQRDRGQWFLGKSGDTFAPLGPWLVTTDEISDPQSLSLCQRVNGAALQNSSTRHMLFSVVQILVDLSRVMTLEAGDVVSTGTPGGIGSARMPPVVLRAGDTVECAISGLGTQRNPVVRREA